MSERNTRQKEIILNTVRSMHNHPTAEEVYERVHESFPTIGRATVFRNLKGLSADGVILHIDIPDSANRFDFNTMPHYHLECERCGGVYDVDMPYKSNILNDVSDAHGFLFKSHNIIFYGLCPNCLEEDKNHGRKES